MIINVCEKCARAEHDEIWFRTQKQVKGRCGLCNKSEDDFGKPLRVARTISYLPTFLFRRPTGVYAQPTRTKWS